MVKVIYFNQWFSSITEVIKNIKELHPNDIKIIASSKNKDHAYKEVVDLFIVEDWEETGSHEESMHNYMDWLVDTCKKYKVDIFFAKKHSETIAKNIDRLNSLGVFTVLEDYSIIKSVNKKSEVYNRLSEEDELKNIVPEYYNGNDRDAISKIILNSGFEDSKPWCFKLDCDEGGASFRAIEQRTLDLKSLNHFRVNSISVNEANSLINRIENNELDKLLFMELLDSPEISVDCYKSKQGFIAICREKIKDTRVQRIYYNEEISKICEKIGDIFNFRFPFNVQFRVAHNEISNKIENLRLLEINPRMSGGTYYSTLFDMNICNVCLCDVLNKVDEYDISKFVKFEDKRVTHVERAISIN